MQHENINIVLVEPMYPGNIGMVCRAMKNMAIENLRIVKGCDRFAPESLKFAVGAKDLLEKAKIFNSLNEAIADCELSVATTRRTGKYRQELVNSDKISKVVEGNKKIAFVFGREDSGLTTEEISLCGIHATIATSEFGSLNLAQAVLIFCYEVFKSNTSYLPNNRELATSAHMESLFEDIKNNLLKIDFIDNQNPDHIMYSIRRMLFRAELDNREVAILRGILRQSNYYFNK